MRVLPYFVGAAVAVAIGGAVAGAAIDTTPRKIHDSPTLPDRPGIAFDKRGSQAVGANHYRLETPEETVEVAQLRDRGLYSQERYVSTYYAPGQANSFDFDAATAEQEQWEAEQARPYRSARNGTRTSVRQPLDLQRPARVADSEIRFVSRPVVQDTSGMER